MLFWILAAAALLALAAFALSQPLTVVTYRLQSARLPREAHLRLALLSDLHDAVYEGRQSTLTDTVLAQKPDAVLLVGDIFDDRRSHKGGELLARQLAGKVPCYYVPGNHEYYTGEAEQLFSLLRDCGVHVLRNRTHLVRMGHANVVLAGLDDYYRTELDEGYSDQDAREHLAAEVNELPGFRILMVHRPERILWDNPFAVDLIVSGHAHGGQWRIPKILNGFYAPGQGFFPKFAGGCFDRGDHHLVVGRGLSNPTFLPRLFNPPEVVIIDLAPAKNKREVK